MLSILKSYLRILFKKIARQSYINHLLGEAIEIGSIHPARTYELAKEALELKPKNPLRRIDAYTIIAEYWSANNNYTEAEKNYMLAYSYREKIDVKDRGILHMEIGMFYNAIHKNDQALLYLQRAMDDFMACDERRLQQDLNMLKADMYGEMGKPEQAVVLLNKVIKERKNDGQTGDLAMPYVKLIDLYLEQRAFDKGESAIANALLYVAEKSQQQVIVWVSVLDFYRTFQSYGKMESLIARIEADEVLNNEPDVLLLLFQYYVDIEAWPEALQLFDEIRAGYFEVENTSRLKFLYLTGLRMYGTMQDLEGGKALYQDYLRLIPSSDKFAMQWLAHSMYGQFLCDLNRQQEGLVEFRLSARALETYRKTVPDTDFDRIDFYSDKVGYLYSYCCVALSQEQKLLAFEFLENAKSKTLIDLLRKERYLETADFTTIKKHLTA